MSSIDKFTAPPPHGNKYIATHDGVFHCDEVAACFMLKQLPTFKDHAIVRTRDENLLNSADVVVDVGGVFDSTKKRFDHHQRAFQLTIKDFHPNVRCTNPDKPTKLSSAGLIYAHYGRQFLAEVLKVTLNSNDHCNKVDSQHSDSSLNSTDHSDQVDGQHSNRSLNQRMLDVVYEKFYSSMMEEIDAIDNGVNSVEGEDIIYNYQLNTDLSSRIARLNPEYESPPVRLKQFNAAMSVVGKELLQCAKELCTSWWPSLDALMHYVKKRHKLDKSGAIVEIPAIEELTWRSSLFEVEEILSIQGQIKFVIFNSPHDQKKWRVTAVPEASKIFKSRLPLKEEWRGLDGDELRKICGIPDALFVHATGFTGGASSKAGAIAMAKKTMESIQTNGDQDESKEKNTKSE